MNIEEKIKKLWEMNYEDFNQYRRDNDLPILLKGFQKYLPYFKEWQSENQIDDTIFLKHTHTGDFFIGDAINYFCEREKIENSNHFNDIFEPTIISNFEFKDDKWNRDKIINQFQFFPYFYWLNTVKNITYFTIEGDPNYNTQTNIRTMMKSGLTSTIARSHFFNTTIEYLSMGGIEIDGNKIFHKKNLDFLGLDNLIITNNLNSSNTVAKFQYCTLDGIVLHSIKNGSFPSHNYNAFLKFNNCEMDKLKIIDCNIQSLYFSNCGIINFEEIYSSELRMFVLNKTSIGRFFMKDSLFSDLRYGNGYNKGIDVKFFNKLAHNYNSSGDFDLAKEYFYRSKKLQMLLWLGLMGNGPFKEFISIFKKLKDSAISGKIFFNKLKYELKNLFGIKKNIANMFKGLLFLFDWLLRGFGKRWYFTLIWLLSLLVFLFIFYTINGKNLFIALEIENLKIGFKNALLVMTSQKDNPSIFEGIMSLFSMLLFSLLIAGGTNRRD